jgi:hypothetical protein
MRILGWVLLIAGLLLCVSILWAAIGFLFMGLGIICLQIAERRTKRLATLAASRSEKSDPQRERLQELSRTLIPSDLDGHEDVDRESTIGQSSYDKERWRVLLNNDADISRVAKVLAPYGQKYVDELAAAYLVRNDKEYLPMILRKIIASARRDSGQNVAGDLLHKDSHDALSGTLGKTRPADRVRELRLDQAYDRTSVNNAPEIDAGLKKVGVLEPSEWNFIRGVRVNPARKTAIEDTNLKLAAAVALVGSDLSAARQIAAEVTNLNPVARGAPAADVSQARKTAIEDTKLEPVPTIARVARDVSAAGQIPTEATNTKPPEIAVAPAGHDEKKGTREVDAIDADNLTDLLNRLVSY